MCSQCLAINFAASLETRSKSLPTSERHSESSGWADQPTGAVRYFEIEPESRMKAQSAFDVLQADNRNTVAIRSGPSCSSMIVSAKRTYFSDCAAIEAPAEKVLESLPTETRCVGAVKANIDYPPATLPSDSLIASKALSVEPVRPRHRSSAGYGPSSTRPNCHSRECYSRGMQLPYLFVAVSLDGRIMGVRFNEGEDGEGLEAQPIAGNPNLLATMPMRLNVMIIDATGQVTCVLLSGPGQVRFRYS